ncbi:RDD family protein [Neisseria sp. S1]|uniref:RDD family protein n=1 Tax=Neisseria sp. S1 TaxID=3318354 RepID=UPI003A83A197
MIYPIMPIILPPVSFKRRLAALIYEGLLIGAVTAVAAIAAGIAATVLNAISPFLSSICVTLILLISWWLYFKLNWNRQGQTLPMKVWKIGLTNQQQVRPPLPQLRLRFMWACVFVVFIPLLAYVGLRDLLHLPPVNAFFMALIWWILPWGFAFFNDDRQFLYDFLSGTRLVNLKKTEE